jgi:hypothetical protein
MSYTVKYLGKSAGKFPYAVLYGTQYIARFAVEAHATRYAEWANSTRSIAL